VLTSIKNPVKYIIMPNKRQITTILIGGQAGDGVKEAGINLGRLLIRAGQEVFISADYQSLIKGGHIFSRVSFGQERIFNDYQAIDLLIALNQESVFLHQKELKSDSLIISETPIKGQVDLPMTEMVKKNGAPNICRTSIALGAVCYYFDLDLKILEEIFQEIFQKKAEINIKLARLGYQSLKDRNFQKRKIKSGKVIKKALLDGNEACARGLVKAGLDIYYAYPMTPATSILHFLAKNKERFGLKTVQPETEIAVINMALGSAYTGKRTALGTSGGGFDLMQEALSLAGITETPLVVILSQRPGPSTGVPTYTTQSELQYARFAGHGEFPRIILGPGDQEEACWLSALALNLAWKYQMSVFVLLDKHLSESLSTIDLEAKKTKIDYGKIAKTNQPYLRYQITADGISPLAFPGTKNKVIKSMSYEHDEFGITTEDPKIVKSMQEKRFRKLKSLVKEQARQETIKIYGDKKSQNIIVSWGSSKGAILEAMKYLKKPIKFILPLWLEPLDTKKIEKHLKIAKKIIDIEANFTGQLASLIREKTGIEIKDKILKYDSRPFEPMELAKKINKWL